MRVLALLPFAVSAIGQSYSAFDSEYEDLNYGVDGGYQDGEHGQLQGCAFACKQLQHTGHEIRVANTTDFDIEKAAYWSGFQADVSPACFVEPVSAEEIANIVKVSRQTQCPFAVKSGGHAAFTGASSIPGGITILLRRLNELQVSEDKMITKVGTGNVWIDVYEYLTPKSLSVVGGRVTAIGTGGLTLGGGISFFSGRYGWACDGIVNYELVTADSQILQVNQSSHPDLYWALRGGGNNFGIVTRLDMETFPQGSIWGGTLMTGPDAFPDLISAFYHYGHRAPEDVDAAGWIAFVHAAEYGGFLSSSFFAHSKGIANPPILANFTALEPLAPPTLRLSNMTDLAKELNGTTYNGIRESYWAHTFQLNENLLLDILEIYKEEVETIKDVPGLLPGLIFHPLTTNTMMHFSRNGGNALGVDDSQGPLFIFQLAYWWTDSASDALVLESTKRVTDRAVERSKELGAFHRHIYQNYAAASQDVFEGYGEENLERLRKISKEWDSEGVFQKLQPGYFKLWRAGES